MPSSLDFAIDGEVSETTIVVSAVTGGAREIVHAFPPDAGSPGLASTLPLVPAITVLDVLEHVVDEEALLASIAERLQPGGTLIVRVPVEGPVTWLDALNLYRYFQDITGLGKKLQETKMKGWQRHYRRAEVAALLEQAGLAVTASRRSGSPHLDVLQLGGLMWGTVVRHDNDIERRLKIWRDRREAGIDLPRLGPLSTKITVTAVKPG
jgi:hypothetical protein